MFWILTVVLTLVTGGLVFVPLNLGLSNLSLAGLWLVGVVLSYLASGINIVYEWDRRPVLLFGRYVNTIGPGFCWVDPAFHTVLADVPVQDNAKELKLENVQTHDNVRLNILGVMTVRIHPDNVRKCVVEVHDVEEALYLRAVSAVTEVVAAIPLDEILGQRMEFCEKVKVALQKKVENWGVDVKAVEVRDLKIADPDIEKSIAMKARATKEAEAELKRAEMQLEITKRLKEAANEFDEKTWKLKGLETLIELGRSANNNTIMLPVQIPELMAATLKQTAPK